jgi:UDP-glucose 4-epimerase
MKKTILILGGAGYIGSHTAYLLAQQGHSIIIIDKYLHQQHFTPTWAHVIKGDFADESLLAHIFKHHTIDAVMHFAAFIEVGLSIINPKEFYDNNVTKTLKLLDLMLEHNVKQLIFSSTCAIYGNPMTPLIDESHPTNPISPYGKGKLCVEFALADYARAYGLQYISLRYFNASGALPEAGLGEQHFPETHLIPKILHALYTNASCSVFGTDYETPDGTCIRDYVHVLDIAQAHIKALEHLMATGMSDCFNLGTGKGASVLEMINVIQKLSGKKLSIDFHSRRPGDASTLVANPSKAYQILGWKPQQSSLEQILSSALRWEEYRRKINKAMFCNTALFI